MYVHIARCVMKYSDVKYFGGRYLEIVYFRSHCPLRYQNCDSEAGVLCVGGGNIAALPVMVFVKAVNQHKSEDITDIERDQPLLSLTGVAGCVVSGDNYN